MRACVRVAHTFIQAALTNDVVVEAVVLLEDEPITPPLAGCPLDRVAGEFSCLPLLGWEELPLPISSPSSLMSWMVSKSPMQASRLLLLTLRACSHSSG